jgi:hypothetical protein
MAKGRNKATSSTGKLIAAAFGLFFLTLSSSIVGTYAWYKVRDFARIDQISMDFSSSPTLQAGVKDEDGNIEYKQVLNEYDFRKGDPNYDANANLKEVSSMFFDGDVSNYADDKAPILRAPYTKSDQKGKTEPAESGFIQIEAFFRSSAPCHLYLTDHTVIKPLEATNALIAKYGYDEDELNRVLDCARLSFYSKEGYHVIELGQQTPSHTKFGGPLQAHNTEGFFDYEEGKEVLYGDYSGTPTYLPALEEDSPIPESPSAFNARHKAGIERVDPTSVTFAEEHTHVLSDFLFDGGSSAGDTICLGTLSPNEDFRLVISIYIEGWDKDLTDTLATGKFSLDLNFTGLLDI